jgi:branched-chain amino acid transport system ATP-binding protein|uniref:ABC transporter ATP-binding protein n=1 Tax=Desulfobacca acetoxidans TaxID=60893 RepID=A0A7C3Z108_9BACT
MPEEVILQSRNLSKRFGDFTAVDRVDYQLRRGEVAGIIGPNGAGKSTFFNLLTGLFPPTEGTVTYRGTDITAQGAHKRVALGLIRTFQLVSVFDSLSVLDNLVLAAVHFRPESRGLLWRFLGNPHAPAVVDNCRAALETVGLAQKLNLPASELSYGDKRKLEIALALALRPQVLLLDEPFAGLSEVEITEVLDLIHRLKEEFTLVIIEHKITRILGLVTRLSVMHEGRLIADGPPDSVLCDETVRRVYWGEVTCPAPELPRGA